MYDNGFDVTTIKKHRTLPARVVSISTPHGVITTPTFMPVGTKAAVSCVTPDDLLTTGTQIILGGNTYHMLCAPGLDVIQSVGGMHPFMGWNSAMLTDSGGFQLFSLSRDSDLCRIDEEGATFRHPSGDLIRLSPEASIETQKIIGADVIMALDECTPDSEDRLVVEAAMNRTHRWLRQSKAHHVRNPMSAYGRKQALFGIIQGGYHRDLRETSARFVISQDLDGIAVGGETIGYDMRKTVRVLEWIVPFIPENKPRYAMGVGLRPQDIIDVVAAGVDMFDCVAPTRNARHGHVFCGRIVRKNGWVSFDSEYPSGRINLKNQQHLTDGGPIMDDCKCMTCAQHSRAYLQYLIKSKSVDYFRLASCHNIQVMQDVCHAMRQCILSEES